MTKQATARLTSTRIFAALSAVLFHLTWTTDFFTNHSVMNLFSSGPTAVSYFFCLSGFVMAIAYSPDGVFKPIQYWIARIARIYPVYLIALVWFGLLGGLSVGKWFLNLTLLQAWIPGSALSGNPPGWSLSTEVAFYLAFPLFIGALGKKWLPVTTVLVIVFWVFSQEMHEYVFTSFYPSYPYPSGLHDTLFYSPIFHFNEFFLGGVCGAWSRRQSPGVVGYRYDILTVVAAITIAALLAYQDYFRSIFVPTNSFPNGALAPLMLAFIYGLPRCRGKWAKVFELAPFLLLGEASYSVYLLQIPWLETIQRSGIFDKFGITGSMRLVFYVLTLVMLSVAMFKLVESPLRKAIRSLSSGGKKLQHELPPWES
ncbi:acyltransferase [Rhodanobacter sp. L36]|uniref:acyltransferase family protein n=1 Tax=Rhodanobacter sp. L36 TaxID=1747221 RepID=UPI00131C555F|nr:acyltransferase [Rhodanobacter sp. L36]